MSTSKIQTFLSSVNRLIDENYTNHFPNTPVERRRRITVSKNKGRRWLKLVEVTQGDLQEHSVWGFISLQDGRHEGVPVRKGDLMKAAGWSSPAKHPRGNIIDGTARWNLYGPDYLK
jgi:hypothetical protein